jgi:hypothetical protein
MIRNTTLAALAAVLSLGLAACEKQGPLERTGEEVDEAVDRVKDGNISEKPISEKADDAVDQVREGAAEATEEAKK